MKIFEQICKSNGINIISEYKFLENRKFRFDYAIVEYKIAIEVEGGIWTYGRHNHSSGFIKDMEKYNLAAENGWILLRFMPDKLLSNKTIDIIKNTILCRM